MNEIENSNEPLLTRMEVVKLFRINPTTLWRWTKAGKLPFFIIKRKKFFLRSEILQTIRNNKTA